MKTHYVIHGKYHYVIIDSGWCYGFICLTTYGVAFFLLFKHILKVSLHFGHLCLIGSKSCRILFL